jgi:predicted O-methyltransferase YrrM
MERSDRLNIPMTIQWEGKSNRKHFLRHLIEKNNFKTMAEVGVRDGRTTFHLLDHCPELTIYAIDMSIKEFFNKEVANRYKNRLIAIEAKSELAADQIADNSLDLVFIDANHSYDYVKKDIIKYTPKLKENGLLTGHDIDYPGVNQAVNEMIKQYDVGPNYVWIKNNL